MTGLLLSTKFWITVLLVSLRVFASIFTTQLLTRLSVPKIVLVMLTIVLSFFIAQLVPSYSGEPTLGTVAVAASNEIVIGLAFAFGVMTMFAAISFGYRLVEFQMGLSMADVIDPVTKSVKPVIGFAIELFAILLFWMMNLHHALIKVLIKSYELFPIGTSSQQLDFVFIVQRASIVFSVGLALVIPIVISIFLVDVGMAYFGRTMPQVNIFFVAIPLKIFIGLFMLLNSLDYLVTMLETHQKEIFDYFARIKA